MRALYVDHWGLLGREEHSSPFSRYWGVNAFRLFIVLTLRLFHFFSHFMFCANDLSEKCIYENHFKPNIDDGILGLVQGYKHMELNQKETHYSSNG